MSRLESELLGEIRRRHHSRRNIEQMIRHILELGRKSNLIPLSYIPLQDIAHISINWF